MNVADTQWNTTRIGDVLSFFPGVIGEFIQETSPADLVRAQQWITHIFWRWYFLQQETKENATPYAYLSWRKQVEKWPRGGQFFPRPTCSITKSRSVRVDVTVEYIAFDEQPLLQDIKRVVAGKKALFSIDPQYTQDLHDMVTLLKHKKMNSRAIMSCYVLHSIMNWYEHDPIVKIAFNRSSWCDFWEAMFAKIKKKEGLSTDELLDKFVYAVREVLPEYGIDSSELHDIEENKAIDLIDIQVHTVFWIHFGCYILIPLSLYTHLAAPVYTDKQLFRNDVSELLSHSYDDPMPIYSPCTALTSTTFGEKVFNHVSLKTLL